MAISLSLHGLLAWPPSYPHLNIAQSSLLTCWNLPQIHAHLKASPSLFPLPQDPISWKSCLNSWFFPPSHSTPNDSLTHWNFTSLSLSAETTVSQGSLTVSPYLIGPFFSCCRGPQRQCWVGVGIVGTPRNEKRVLLFFYHSNYVS